MELKELTLKPGEQIIINKSEPISVIIKHATIGLEVYGPLNDRGETYTLTGIGFFPKTVEQSRLHRRRLKQDINILAVGVFLGLLGGYALFSG